MNKNLLLATTSAVFVAAASAAAPASAAPSVKNIVLVHGAFADGSGWMAVAKILRRDGFTVSVAQPPETSLEDDVAATNRTIDAMGGPVVLRVTVTGASSSQPPAITNTSKHWFTLRHSSATPARA